MKAMKGVMLTCDSAVKQLLVMMDDKAEYKFIIQDLDENHVLIKAELYDRVRQELEQELEKNAYTQEQ